MSLINPISWLTFHEKAEARGPMPATVARPTMIPPPVEPVPYETVRSMPPTVAPLDSPSGNALFRPGQSTALPVPSIISKLDETPVSFESPLPLGDVLNLIPFQTVEQLSLLRYLPPETKLIIPGSVHKSAWDKYLKLHNEPFSWQRPEVQWIYLSLAFDEYLVTRTNDLAQALSSHPSYYTLHDYSVDYRNDPLFLNIDEFPEDILMQNTPLWRINKEGWVENAQANEILRSVRKGEMSIHDLLRNGVMITGGEAAVEEMVAERRKADAGSWFNFLTELMRGAGNEAMATWFETLGRGSFHEKRFQSSTAPVAMAGKKSAEGQFTGRTSSDQSILSVLENAQWQKNLLAVSPRRAQLISKEDEMSYEKAVEWFLNLKDLLGWSDAEMASYLKQTFDRAVYASGMAPAGVSAPICAINLVRAKQLAKFYDLQNNRIGPTDYVWEAFVFDRLIRQWDPQSQEYRPLFYESQDTIDAFLSWLGGQIDETKLTPNERTVFEFVTREPETL